MTGVKIPVVSEQFLIGLEVPDREVQAASSSPKLRAVALRFVSPTCSATYHMFGLQLQVQWRQKNIFPDSQIPDC